MIGVRTNKPDPQGGAPVHLTVGDRTLCGKPIGAGWKPTRIDHDRQMCRRCKVVAA